MPNKDPNKFSPEDQGYRADWYLELLTAWEEALAVAERKNYQQVARNLKTAIIILKSSYSTEELCDIEKLAALEAKLLPEKTKK